MSDLVTVHEIPAAGSAEVFVLVPFQPRKSA
jgi:hypothetical protein